MNTTLHRNDTVRIIDAKILAALNGGAGGSGQTLSYTADPNAEGLKPTNTAKSAIATPTNGVGPWYVWVVSSQTWV